MRSIAIQWSRILTFVHIHAHAQQLGRRDGVPRDAQPAILLRAGLDLLQQIVARFLDRGIGDQGPRRLHLRVQSERHGIRAPPAAALAAPRIRPLAARAGPPGAHSRSIRRRGILPADVNVQRSGHFGGRERSQRRGPVETARGRNCCQNCVPAASTVTASLHCLQGPASTL